MNPHEPKNQTKQRKLTKNKTAWSFGRPKVAIRKRKEVPLRKKDEQLTTLGVAQKTYSLNLLNTFQKLLHENVNILFDEDSLSNESSEAKETSETDRLVHQRLLERINHHSLSLKGNKSPNIFTKNTTDDPSLVTSLSYRSQNASRSHSESPAGVTKDDVLIADQPYDSSYANRKSEDKTVVLYVKKHIGSPPPVSSRKSLETTTVSPLRNTLFVADAQENQKTNEVNQGSVQMDNTPCQNEPIKKPIAFEKLSTDGDERFTPKNNLKVTTFLHNLNETYLKQDVEPFFDVNTCTKFSNPLLQSECVDSLKKSLVLGDVLLKGKGAPPESPGRGMRKFPQQNATKIETSHLRNSAALFFNAKNSTHEAQSTINGSTNEDQNKWRPPRLKTINIQEQRKNFKQSKPAVKLMKVPSFPSVKSKWQRKSVSLNAPSGTTVRQHLLNDNFSLGKICEKNASKDEMVRRFSNFLNLKEEVGSSTYITPKNNKRLSMTRKSVKRVELGVVVKRPLHILPHQIPHGVEDPLRNVKTARRSSPLGFLSDSDGESLEHSQCLNQDSWRESCSFSLKKQVIRSSSKPEILEKLTDFTTPQLAQSDFSTKRYSSGKMNQNAKMKSFEEASRHISSFSGAFLQNFPSHINGTQNMPHKSSKILRLWDAESDKHSSPPPVKDTVSDSIDGRDLTLLESSSSIMVQEPKALVQDVLWNSHEKEEDSRYETCNKFTCGAETAISIANGIFSLPFSKQSITTSPQQITTQRMHQSLNGNEMRGNCMGLHEEVLFKKSPRVLGPSLSRLSVSPKCKINDQNLPKIDFYRSVNTILKTNGTKKEESDKLIIAQLPKKTTTSCTRETIKEGLDLASRRDTTGISKSMASIHQLSKENFTSILDVKEPFVIHQPIKDLTIHSSSISSNLLEEHTKLFQDTTKDQCFSKTRSFRLNSIRDNETVTSSTISREESPATFAPHEKQTLTNASESKPIQSSEGRKKKDIRDLSVPFYSKNIISKKSISIPQDKASTLLQKIPTTVTQTAKSEKGEAEKSLIQETSSSLSDGDTLQHQRSSGSYRSRSVQLPKIYQNDNPSRHHGTPLTVVANEINQGVFKAPDSKTFLRMDKKNRLTKCAGSLNTNPPPTRMMSSEGTNDSGTILRSTKGTLKNVVEHQCRKEEPQPCEFYRYRPHCTTTRTAVLWSADISEPSDEKVEDHSTYQAYEQQKSRCFSYSSQPLKRLQEKKPAPFSESVAQHMHPIQEVVLMFDAIHKKSLNTSTYNKINVQHPRNLLSKPVEKQFLCDIFKPCYQTFQLGTACTTQHQTQDVEVTRIKYEVPEAFHSYRQMEYSLRKKAKELKHLLNESENLICSSLNFNILSHCENRLTNWIEMARLILCLEESITQAPLELLWVLAASIRYGPSHQWDTYFSYIGNLFVQRLKLNSIQREQLDYLVLNATETQRSSFFLKVKHLFKDL